MSDNSSWQPRNDRDTCVCGAARKYIRENIYRPVPWYDCVTPAYFYRCAECGTLSAVNLHFNPESYSAVAIENYSIPEMKRLMNRIRVEWIRARVGTGFPHDPVVYDLGSGEGTFTGCIGEALPQARVFAVETDERLREKFPDEYRAATFVPEMIEPFLERVSAHPEADLIVLCDVLEHVLDPESLLRLIAGALKPGGFAYVTVPNLDSYGTYPHRIPAPEVDWSLANWTAQHLWMMHPRVLNDLVNRHFQIREMSRTFEWKIRRDADYSTFLLQR